MESEISVLKIYMSSTDSHKQKLMYENVVELAKKHSVEGVTVYRGIMGYGASSNRISNSRFWELTEKLPVVIEMVDVRIKLLEFFSIIKKELEDFSKGCVVTIHPAEVLFKKTGVNK